MAKADSIGFPASHAPGFPLSAVLVTLPVVIALIAENAGHINAVGETTGAPLDDELGTPITAAVRPRCCRRRTRSCHDGYAESIGVFAL